jgi:hypothetical protein
MDFFEVAPVPLLNSQPAGIEGSFHYHDLNLFPDSGMVTIKS